MALFFPRRWRRQPQYSVRVNLGHPLARGLVSSATPIESGLVTATPATIQGNIITSSGAAGRAWQGAYQASGNYVRIERGDHTYTTAVTFEALVEVFAFQTNIAPYITGVISQYPGAAIGPDLRFNNDGTAGQAAKPNFFVVIGGVERRAFGASALNVNQIYHLLGTYDGANVKLYVDGIEVGTTAITGAFTNSATNYISLASDSTTDVPSQNRCLNGRLYLARIYRESKTAAEVKALADNPWQIFQPQTARIYSFAPAGITITAIVDALIVAEQAAVVAQGININGIVDALTIAEQAAAVTQAINVNAVVDALVIAEQMAVVSVGGSMTINAAVDALIIAEQLSVVSIPIAVTASVDTLVIAEQAAVVAQGINVNAFVDALVIAEQAAAVTQAITLTAVVDSLVISEQVAAISLGSSLAINAAVDALVIAEQTATITLAITINGVAETLVFTEYAASITLSALGGVEAPSTALLRSYAALEIPELFNFATSELGETITINGIAKHAIGVTPYQNVPFGEIGMAGRISEFMIDAAAFDAAVGIIDSLVVMRGVTYTIERIQRLDSGVVIAELSR